MIFESMIDYTLIYVYSVFVFWADIVVHNILIYALIKLLLFIKFMNTLKDHPLSKLVDTFWIDTIYLYVMLVD